MKPTKNSDWEYVKEKSVTATKVPGEDQDELYDLWADMNKDEFDDLDPGDTPFTFPLIGGDATAIKQLANSESVENLRLRVQPDGKCVSQLKECKEKSEDWTSKAKTGHLPARAVWQSFTQQLWSSTKYGLGACTATLKELENGLGSTDFSLISTLGAAMSILTALRYMPQFYCGTELHSLQVETTVA